MNIPEFRDVTLEQAPDYSEPIEKLCRQATFRLGVLGGRHGSPKGVTLERCHPVQKVGQVGPHVNRSF